jgi:hypothetical protein
VGQEFIIDYNKETYEQAISIFRLGRDGDDNPDKLQYDKFLLNDYVRTIQFVSDITYPIMVGYITFRDIGRNLMPKVKTDGYSFLRIDISKIEGYNVPFNFAHAFVITDVELIDKTEDVFKIHLISHMWYSFDNKVVYTTSGKIVPFTTVLRNVMVRGGLNVNQTFRETDTTGEYVTPAPWSLLETVRDVIDNCASSNSGFYFLQFDHLLDKYNILSSTTMMNDYDNISRYNQLVLPTAQTGAADNNMTLSNITLKDYSGFEKTVNATKEQTIRYFDYDAREWKQKVQTRRNINTMLPKPQRPDYEISYKEVPKYIPAGIRKTRRETLSPNQFYSERVKEAFVLKDTMVGGTYGVLERKAGDMLFMMVDVNSEYYHRVAGGWFITRVIHTFEQQSYSNEIQACRSDIAKEIDVNV